MKPLLAVRHEAAAPLGIAARALALEGVPYRYLDAWEAEDWPDATDFSGIVVLGGEMSAEQLEDYPWLKGVHEILRRALDSGVPILGVCLGAQELASVLGAEVGESPVKEVGFQRVAATAAGRADPVTAPFAEVGRIFQWHRDAFELPAGAELLYTSESVPNQAFRVGRVAYAIQFHFEVDAGIIAGWCDDVGDEAMQQEWGVTKDELLAQADAHLGGQRAAGLASVRAFTQLLARDG
jgi:GMP synthase (glutamine-hydrolysing)